MCSIQVYRLQSNLDAKDVAIVTNQNANIYGSTQHTHTYAPS